MLEQAHTESESHQAALGDCQDMLEELQTFSQSQESKLHQLQSQLQVPCCLRCCAARCTDAHAVKTNNEELPCLNKQVAVC